MKTYIFDIDGVICNLKNDDHYFYYLKNLIPNMEVIDAINKLYDDGNTIIFMTGRGTQTGIDWREETEKQLSIRGVKYHELRFINKPLDYLYVDDHACSIEEFIEKIRYGEFKD